jgi:pyrimidine operon attenuation protein/uracil phosphoribosyltransferase
MPAPKLTFVPYLQAWEPVTRTLSLRVLVAPTGNPLEPLLAVPPGLPAFADTELSFRVFVSDAVGALPMRTNVDQTADTPRRGSPDARTIFQAIKEALDRIKSDNAILCGAIDAGMHRDDIGMRPVVAAHSSSIPVDLSGATVILVDDVLFTGRTVRAALEALNEYGRPRCVQLAVLVDRGHRELPIRPDFVGKNIPTKATDEVSVSADGVFVEAR